MLFPAICFVFLQGPQSLIKNFNLRAWVEFPLSVLEFSATNYR